VPRDISSAKAKDLPPSFDRPRRGIAEFRHHAFDDRDLRMSTERRTIPLMRDTSAALNCPLAPPASASVYARTLHRACLVLGGLEALARHLTEPEEFLRRWLMGEQEPPERVFLACVEVVLLHAAGQGRGN
jgi:hypothetical protein